MLEYSKRILEMACGAEIELSGTTVTVWPLSASKYHITSTWSMIGHISAVPNEVTITDDVIFLDDIPGFARPR